MDELMDLFNGAIVAINVGIQDLEARWKSKGSRSSM